MTLSYKTDQIQRLWFVHDYGAL